MKSSYQPKKRFKSSKFDPYIDEIKKLVEMGISTSKIAIQIENHFEDIVSEDALYTFIKHRGLKSKIPKCLNAPRCENCEKCIEITNTFGTKSNLCMESKQMINKCVVTSPSWCIKRRVA